MPKAAKPPESFEAGYAELEALIGELESGQLPLEASLAAYQRGQALLQFCQGKLADAEQQLKVLENGELKPFSPEEGA
ncbi:exodeoxyribonuclease VII small subunit [Chitinolyticbacter meiyuanensis]|uniref:exodeoxyribonuclease VII small subunit n=1 Tax=Chitinolyticbacter meiyuanensis TaxID=682798 RepID=UPI0011E59FB1|nr:exodeoxyribonuclease VII small subunit [Chitinolyticbacter meiyuanensis]